MFPPICDNNTRNSARRAWQAQGAQGSGFGDAENSEYVFVSERGSPFTSAGFAKLIERAGREAGFKFGAHPHMLRHAAGYKLANDGVDTRSLQAYLGHKNIQHTVRYSEMSPTRFKMLWGRRRGYGTIVAAETTDGAPP
jgi:site-specific recombinase XerD